MAKRLTDKELGNIIHQAVNDPAVIECADAYAHFLEGLSELIADNFGGEFQAVTYVRSIGWCASFTVATPKISHSPFIGTK